MCAIEVCEGLLALCCLFSNSNIYVNDGGVKCGDEMTSYNWSPYICMFFGTSHLAYKLP